jgi:hypothetical protein
MMAKLGMPQWSYAVITAADPLAGLLVQSLFGSMSDWSRSKFGGRPFILSRSFIVLVVLFFADLSGAACPMPFHHQTREFVRVQSWCCL